MSKYDEIAGLLGDTITFDEATNRIDIGKAYSVWEDTLPVGQNAATVAALADHTAEFSAAFGAVTSRLVTEAAKKNDDLGYAGATLLTEIGEFGFEFARAPKGSSREVIRGGYAHTVTVRTSERLDEITDAMADMWAETVEEF